MAPATAPSAKAIGSVARNGTPYRFIATTAAKPPAIAKAPCARFTKFMRPIVTDRPTLTRKSRLPYAMPSKRTPITPILSPALSQGRGRTSLAGVLHIRKLVELHVPVLAAALLDLAHVHRLHDVARGRIDRDGAAWARELQRFQHLHRLVAVDVAAEPLHGLGDRRHAVVAADRHEVRPPHVRGDLAEGGDEGLVLGRLVRGRVVVRRDHADHGIADRVE